MIGRPRRRHVVDRTGHLRHLPKSTNTRQSTKKTGRKTSLALPSLPKIRPKTMGLALVALVAVGALWVVGGLLLTYGKVVDSNGTPRAPLLSFLGEIDPNRLNGEGDGRVNVLMIGIGGAGHRGGQLADTIMVASLDPKNKEAALLSIPRDLWVPIEGNGYGKINTAHAFGVKNEKKTGGGPVVMKKTVSKILDLPIHYYIRVDFKALQKIVDTMDGVTVVVENPIIDNAFPADNMIDYAPFRLPAGKQTLDGKTALKYVRSRHTVGAEGTDFARARRQQILIEAIKDKGLSLGILSNPRKLASFFSILGDNVKTDITISEAERFFQIWKNVDRSKMVNTVLDNGPNGPLIASSGDARGSILLPRTGDFSEIQQIAHSIFTDPFLRQEKANISLINATGDAALGAKTVKQLTSYGYKVTDNTLKGQSIQKKVEIIDQTGSKPYTIRFLESRFKVEAVSRNDKSSKYDIILTLGTSYKPETVKASLKLPAGQKSTVRVGAKDLKDLNVPTKE